MEAVMVFSKSLDKPAILKREWREWANFTNCFEFIRAIRKFAAHLHCTERSAVQVFALRILRP
jgi:hypothetical protein